mmetsp:Transcript_2863/g.6087  ORF Transcript_2863/g.6087 Transcript_2863/m.6087 type:complete len:252 (+) Transcript_2863:777-1532(+)
MNMCELDLGLRFHFVELHLHLVHLLVAALLLLLTLLLLALQQRRDLFLLPQRQHVMLLRNLLLGILRDHHRLLGHLLDDLIGKLDVSDDHIGDRDALRHELVVERPSHILRDVTTLRGCSSCLLSVLWTLDLAQRRVTLIIVRRVGRRRAARENLCGLTRSVRAETVHLDVLERARDRPRGLLACIHQLLLQATCAHLVDKLAHEIWILAELLIAHDAEDDSEVDLDSHVVLGLATLHGHVEHDALLADKA